MPWRNFSRSSGVMRPQRSPMRRPEYERCHPRPLTPPKRIRHSASIATACQKVSRRQPKSGGSSQFHRLITSQPPMAIKSAIPMIAAGIMKISFLNFGLMFSPSCFRKLVVNALQPFAQVQHGIAFAREQRIDANAAFGGHLFKTAALDLVADKHLALLGG